MSDIDQVKCWNKEGFHFYFNIGGSKGGGARDTRPSRSNFLAPPPVWEILDPPLVKAGIVKFLTNQICLYRKCNYKRSKSLAWWNTQSEQHDQISAEHRVLRLMVQTSRWTTDDAQYAAKNLRWTVRIRKKNLQRNFDATR